MINFNLREDKHKNHELDGRYGKIMLNGRYAGYPVTIVDNHDEVEKGMYTGKPSLCLIHLSENVREYTRLKVFSEFLYLSFWGGSPTYRMYDYTKVTLSNDEIVHALKDVLYRVQPSLQSRSMVGSSDNSLEADPNYYEGQYVLNDEEVYTILKYRTQYKIYKGKKKYYPDWKLTEDLLYEGEIDFNVYKIALEVFNLRRKIVTYTNELLDENSLEIIGTYNKLKKQLDDMLTTI